MPPPPTLTGTSGIRRALPVLPMALIAGLLLFGADAMAGQLIRSGYVDFARPLLADDGLPHLLPGSDRPLVRHYVGVPAVDRYLATANVFWANVADGARPQLSLFAFYFGMQLVAFFTVFLVESRRVAKWSWLLSSPLLWGFLMQTFGFGLVVPVFFILHLAVSSRSTLADTVRLRDPTSLHTVAPAFTLGYFIPSLVLAFPFPQANLRQWANIVWQAFPLHVVLCQAVFTGVVKRTSLGQDAFTSPVQLDRRALSRAYGFAWNVAVTGQLCTYAVLVAASMAPKLFPPGVARTLSFAGVFIPGPPHSSAPMTSPAAVVHDFFRYDLYVGSAVALVWAVYLLSQVRPSGPEERANLTRGVVMSLCLSGPGGALVALLQHRDETVLAAEVKAEKLH
ncbi:hypothetical protein B0J13DRAFT_323102 [Dactylonectria estremocensis]|uniref:Uncharacterized protein n=1 Tax=Dactylonectria estremocensis TaxID=1079267 RepID=A0A9P9J7S4_9HYPO|nr:hypothetical protein B0J13DRAFT_323102 [Dactylonectria estremocensis]